jgi:hypothetical protein
MAEENAAHVNAAHDVAAKERRIAPQNCTRRGVLLRRTPHTSMPHRRCRRGASPKRTPTWRAALPHTTSPPRRIATQCRTQHGSVGRRDAAAHGAASIGWWIHATVFQPLRLKQQYPAAYRAKRNVPNTMVQKRTGGAHLGYSAYPLRCKAKKQSPQVSFWSTCGTHVRRFQYGPGARSGLKQR